MQIPTEVPAVLVPRYQFPLGSPAFLLFLFYETTADRAGYGQMSKTCELSTWVVRRRQVQVHRTVLCGGHSRKHLRQALDDDDDDDDDSVLAYIHSARRNRSLVRFSPTCCRVGLRFWASPRTPLPPRTVTW